MTTKDTSPSPQVGTFKTRFASSQEDLSSLLLGNFRLGEHCRCGLDASLPFHRIWFHSFVFANQFEMYGSVQFLREGIITGELPFEVNNGRISTTFVQSRPSLFWKVHAQPLTSNPSEHLEPPFELPANALVSSGRVDQVSPVTTPSYLMLWIVDIPYDICASADVAIVNVERAVWPGTIYWDPMFNAVAGVYNTLASLSLAVQSSNVRF